VLFAKRFIFPCVYRVTKYNVYMSNENIKHKNLNLLIVLFKAPKKFHPFIFVKIYFG
jgi:hypothetical protein